MARSHSTRERPLDVHRHVFTTESFRDLLRGLRELELSPFVEVETRDVARNLNEFLVLLRIPETT